LLDESEIWFISSLKTLGNIENTTYGAENTDFYAQNYPYFTPTERKTWVKQAKVRLTKPQMHSVLQNSILWYPDFQSA